MLVYLDGQVLPLAQARISPEDRAFLFADGVYEAVVARRGRLLFWAEPEVRLRAGLAALRIDLPDPAALCGVAEDLLRRNDLLGGDALVYLQGSRGAAPRLHSFPNPPVPPTHRRAGGRGGGHPAGVVAGGAHDADRRRHALGALRRQVDGAARQRARS